MVFSLKVYIIDATKPQDGLRRIHKRAPGVQYFLEHHSGYFYVLTNAPLRERKFSCGNYYLAMCRVEDIQSASWQVNFLHYFFDGCTFLILVNLT